jgi:hypothetical protein
LGRCYDDDDEEGGGGGGKHIKLLKSTAKIQSDNVSGTNKT